MSIPTITPQQLDALRAEGQPVDLIDVRTPAEFREVHIPFARSVPLDRLDLSTLTQHSAGQTAATLYVVCRSGSRGRTACERLTAAGVTNVINVEGGTLAWEGAGLPVVRGKKTMSLERQVRIAAGTLVVVGVLLGWLVDDAFAGLAAFVGAGLIFAGLTDTCGMGLLLARMPWNRVQEEVPSAVKPKQACSIQSRGVG